MTGINRCIGCRYREGRSASEGRAADIRVALVNSVTDDVFSRHLALVVASRETYPRRRKKNVQPTRKETSATQSRPNAENTVVRLGERCSQIRTEEIAVITRYMQSRGLSVKDGRISR